MDVFRSIVQLLADGESLVLAVVVSRSGSAPRAVGTRMIVRQDGSIVGTIGGGILEAQVMELAKEVFGSERPMLRKFVFSAEDAAGMGMICGGQVKVLLQFLDASHPHGIELYGEIHATLQSRKRAWLITEIPSDSDGAAAPSPSLMRSDGTLLGGLEPSMARELTAQASTGQPEVLLQDERRYLVESLCHQGAVYIFGAGHIAQKLAPLTRQVGFQTIVLDDRLEFANRERFDSADDIIVLDSFHSAMEGLEINNDSYLVLVTRGHAHDRTVLEQALRTDAGYIGMIGSRRKRDAIYDALCKQGFQREILQRVHSPIGLDIGAETPEEIAVSIVGELIQARAEKTR